MVYAGISNSKTYFMIRTRNILLPAMLVCSIFTACDTTNSEEQDAAINAAKTDSLAAAEVADKTVVDNNTVIPIGKPNPAKKGGKGKIKPVVLVNSSGEKMEMDSDGIYSAAESQPEYPGGEDALQKFIEKNIVYPQSAIDEGVEGTVRLSFAIDENGNVYKTQVIGDKMGYGLEEEAMKVMSKMPKWKPGKIKGKSVKTKLSLPISFEIG